MKSISHPLLYVIGLATLLLSSCVKDTQTRTYTTFTPVYETKTNIKQQLKVQKTQKVERPGKIYVYKNYLLINEINRGIHIIKNYNQTNAEKLGFIPIPGNVDMAIVNDILYVDCFSDLFALDISDINNIKLTKEVNNVFFTRYYQNPNADKIIIDWVKKDTTIDANNYDLEIRYQTIYNDYYAASNSNNSSTGTAGSMSRFTNLRQTLYALNSFQLNIVDISTPSQPNLVKEIPIRSGLETIYPFKNNLFIGSKTGMFIYDASNAHSPELLSTFEHANVCDPVIADDEYAYVTLRDGTECNGFTNELNVLDITNIKQSKLLKKYDMTNPHGLSKDNQWLFICDGRDGIKVLDASNPKDIKPFSKVNIADTYDIICIGKTAIVSAKNGIYILDYSNINQIKIINQF